MWDVGVNAVGALAAVGLLGLLSLVRSRMQGNSEKNYPPIRSHSLLSSCTKDIHDLDTVFEFAPDPVVLKHHDGKGDHFAG